MGGDTITDIGKIMASVAFRQLDLYKEVPYYCQAASDLLYYHM